MSLRKPTCLQTSYSPPPAHPFSPSHLCTSVPTGLCIAICSQVLNSSPKLPLIFALLIPLTPPNPSTSTAYPTTPKLAVNTSTTNSSQLENAFSTASGV